MRRCIGLKLSLFLALCAVIKASLAGQVPFTTEDVEFSSGGVTLAGTVFRPEHPLAGVVLVHGSGQEKRMTGFATRLAQNGIEVLTYDKRGVGQSGGTYVGPEVGTNNLDAGNLVLLASDANAALATLSAQPGAASIPIGLAGFSQAGWIIPLAAGQNRQARFMVFFSGPVLTTLEQLRFQFYTAGKADFWSTHTDADARKHLAEDPDRYQFAPTDPRDALERLSIPGLWLFGGQDVQAPSRVSMERLDRLKAQGRPFDYRLYPALGHNVTPVGANEPFDAAVEWIRNRKPLTP